MSKKNKQNKTNKESSSNKAIDFFCQTKGMSLDQIKVFKSVVLDDCNHYIGGNPGTGKSYLLTCLKQFLGQKLKVTSTTGISALNVKGITLHSFMSFYHINMDFDSLVNQIVQRSGSKFRKLQTIVIEECSMCDALIFSLFDYCLKKARNCDKPFGGVKVILIGDFMQLPPVNDYGFLFTTKAFIEGNFKKHILTYSHRQADPTFYKILQECRMNELSTSAFETLKTREVETISENILRIYCTNKEVDAWNKYKFDQLNSEPKTYIAQDESINSKYDSLFDKNSLIEKEITLKVGCRVILLKNIDQLNGLINGSQGTVIACKPHYVTVEFDNNIVRDIQFYSNEYMIDGQIVATRNQIPLRLAYAITSHKSQGMTLETAFIDLNKVFAPGQAYVALSRLKSLDGLYLKNLRKNSFKTDPSALSFYKDLQKELNLKNTSSQTAEEKKAYYKNLFLSNVKRSKK